MNGGRNNNTYETINAAANVIASAENRLHQASPVQKKRWGSCWSLYWCFGSNKQKTRIGHAVLEPTAGTEVSAEQNLNQALSVILPFIAPPSSPASFLQSEPPSTLQSPAGLVSHSANVYSPAGPASMFAIGPYANETQLVSPPVFSTFNTEPSTAPFTPPESLQLTTPSSPEVPFAQLLDPKHRSGDGSKIYPLPQYEFQPYQLHPGSPLGQLVSPSSGISNSGTSSPFPDHDSTPGRQHFLDFRTGNPPKLLSLAKLSPHKWGSQQGSSLTPDTAGPKSHDGSVLQYQNSDLSALKNASNVWKIDETAIDQRVSFEITAEVGRCVENNLVASPKVLSVLEYVECIPEGEEDSDNLANDHECHKGATSDETQKRACGDCEDREKHPSVTLGSSREFIFDNAEGGKSEKPTSIGSDWWANERVIGKEAIPSKNWAFFPAIQPSVS